LLYLLLGCKKEAPPKNPDTDYIEYESNLGKIGSGGGSVMINNSSSVMALFYNRIEPLFLTNKFID